MKTFKNNTINNTVIDAISISTTYMGISLLLQAVAKSDKAKSQVIGLVIPITLLSVIAGVALSHIAKKELLENYSSKQ